jgi:hypothetical protein
MKGGSDGWRNAPQDGRSRVRFPVGTFKRPNSSVPGGVRSVSNRSIKEFPWEWVRKASTADNSTVLIVQNVKARMQAQHSIPPPPLIMHDLSGKSLPLPFILVWNVFHVTLLALRTLEKFVSLLQCVRVDQWRVIYAKSSWRQQLSDFPASMLVNAVYTGK